MANANLQTGVLKTATIQPVSKPSILYTGTVDRSVLKTINSRKAALRLRYKNEALVNMDHLPFDSFERRKKTTSLEEYVGHLRIYLRYESNLRSES